MFRLKVRQWMCPNERFQSEDHTFSAGSAGVEFNVPFSNELLRMFKADITSCMEALEKIGIQMKNRAHSEHYQRLS